MIEDSWNRAVPDEPRWVEVRSMILSGTSTALGEPDGGVVVAASGDLGGVVGLPSLEMVHQTLEMLAPDGDLLVPAESMAHIGELLPDVKLRRAMVHSLDQPFVPVLVDGVEVSAVDESLVASLPEVLREEAEGALFAAVRRAQGEVVAICAAWSITETLWDVGIDTVEEHRRRGHATVCYLGLASYLADRSLQPVWGAYEDNLSSLAMARSLGFQRVADLWVIESRGLG